VTLPLAIEDHRARELIGHEHAMCVRAVHSPARGPCQSEHQSRVGVPVDWRRPHAIRPDRQCAVTPRRRRVRGA
jgi:hypothetical protein